MKLKMFCFAAVLAVLPTMAVALPSCSVTFSESDLRITPRIHDDDTFDVVGLNGTNSLLGQVGLPSLPAKRFYMLIPQDCRVASVNITYLDTSSLSGDYYVLPCQLPALTNGGPPPPFVEPDSAAYSSTSLYPDCFATCIGEGFSSGYKLAEIEVHPVRYVASERRLLFCSSVHITLSLEQCENLARPVYRRSDLTQQHIEKTVRAMVVSAGASIPARPAYGRLSCAWVRQSA